MDQAANTRKGDQTNKIKPDFAFETSLMQRGVSPIAGVDEAGRGPWAGPVVAGAVILDPGAIPDGLDDSKRLTEVQREALYEEIIICARWGIGIADVVRVDEMNILYASLWAMGEAVAALDVQPAFVLVDGNKLPDLNGIEAKALVKGDQRSLSIAAASIIAKVTRDRMMGELDAQFPEYAFSKHKGYGTKAHQMALMSHGVTAHHRRSFKPIKALL